MLKKTIFVIITSFILISCNNSTESTRIKSLQKKDKRLSCKEVLLEINEANFYKKMAYRNKGPKLKNILMPLGYISTYMSADEAIGAAEARVDYLDQIYEIMKCEEKEDLQDEVPVYKPLGQNEYSPETGEHMNYKFYKIY